MEERLRDQIKDGWCEMRILVLIALTFGMGVLVLSLTPMAGAQTRNFASQSDLDYAQAPARTGAKPRGGGERCYRSFFMGLPNCDNPQNVDSGKK